MASSAPAASRSRSASGRSSAAIGTVSASCGRLTAAESSWTRTQALRATSPDRARPPRTPSSIFAFSSAKPSAVLPYHVYHVFHQSTCGSVRPSIRGPIEPAISGTRRAGSGSSTASSALQ